MNELEDIQAMLSSFIGAFNNLDWERFCACFAVDATVFHPDNPETERLERIEGRAAIEHSFKPVFDAASRVSPRQQIEPKRVHVQML